MFSEHMPSRTKCVNMQQDDWRFGAKTGTNGVASYIFTHKMLIQTLSTALRKHTYTTERAEANTGRKDWDGLRGKWIRQVADSCTWPEGWGGGRNKTVAGGIQNGKPIEHWSLRSKPKQSEENKNRKTQKHFQQNKHKPADIKNSTQHRANEHPPWNMQVLRNSQNV